MPRDGTATRERILDAAQRIVLERGFAATSVDAVLAEAPATKGAFFHHFPSKNDLGRALLERYAAADERMLDDFMAAAEAESDDPAEQLVAFVRHFEQAADELAPTQPGCLFVSFIYESQLAGDGDDDLIATSIRHWRARLLEKLEAAAQRASAGHRRSTCPPSPTRSSPRSKADSSSPAPCTTRAICAHSSPTCATTSSCSSNSLRIRPHATDQPTADD